MKPPHPPVFLLLTGDVIVSKRTGPLLRTL